VLGLAYVLHDVRVAQVDHDVSAPLVRADSVRVRFHPFTRSSEVEVDGLRLHLIDADDDSAQLGAGVRWRHFLDELAPRHPVRRVRVNAAALTVAFSRDAMPAIKIEAMDATVEGLTLGTPDSDPMPATLAIDARVLGHAPMRLSARFDPDGPMQALALELQIDTLQLPQLDSYAPLMNDIDFERGTAKVDIEIRSQESAVQGRMIATLRDIDVFDADEDLGNDGDGLLEAARELVAGAATHLAQRDGELTVERQIDTRLELPEDNLDGLRAVLVAAASNLR
jgi:hypothetical protein